MKFKNFIIPLSIALLFGCGGSGSSTSRNNYFSEENILSNLPDVSTLKKYYFDYSTTTVNLTIELENIPAISILHMNGFEVSTRDYLYENNILTIGNGFLVETGYGKHVLSINETLHYCIVIYDDREPVLIGSNYYKYLGYNHPTFEFGLFGAEVTSLIYNEIDYSEYILNVKNDIVKIDATFCETILDTGDNNIKIIVEKDLPNDPLIKEFDLVIYVPKTGDIVIGTPVVSSYPESISVTTE